MLKVFLEEVDNLCCPQLHFNEETAPSVPQVLPTSEIERLLSVLNSSDSPSDIFSLLFFIYLTYWRCLRL